MTKQNHKDIIEKGKQLLLEKGFKPNEIHTEFGLWKYCLDLVGWDNDIEDEDTSSSKEMMGED